MLSSQGLEVARSLSEAQPEPFVRKSMIISDGADGKQGGLALLRTGNASSQTSLVLKYTSQGMGHGHFDRLSFTLYDSGHEIVSDYGSARFINVETKDGGRYLTENTTWAKQTVAHNTVVIDETSDFNGSVSEASKFHPDLLFADTNDDSFQIVAAVDSNCYKGAVLQRTMALVNNPHGRFVIDLFRIVSDGTDLVCDMPLYYQGQIMSTNFPYDRALTDMKVLGKENGYQQLWVEGSVDNLSGPASTTFMNNKRFYTWSVLTDQISKLFFTRIGANDPNFNLRSEPGLLLRQKAEKSHVFFNVLEMHSDYNPATEDVMKSNGSLKNMKMIFQNEDATGIELTFNDGGSMILLVANHPGATVSHDVKVDDKQYKWEGNYKLNTN